MQALISKALGLEQLDPDQDIFELGADSLLIVQLLANVRTTRGVDVSLADFLNEATATALARLIAGDGQADAADDLEARIPFEDPERLRRILDELERLSDAEVAQALAAHTHPAHRQ